MIHLPTHQDEHPRLVHLRRQVMALPIDEDYRTRLLQAINTYRDQILARPSYARDAGWDDLEALQQVTLGDMMEFNLYKQPRNRADEQS